ncbi:TPA: WGR domain-containing protein [Legionella pneumophila]|nr:WGR domain-containing protein [Legionella pneumophila]HAU1500469.1 WGR domain-containing protein [Legionella pneumophila]HAU1519463.1 WGR domain-containing protein [Legionella pneumophila]
MIAWFTTPCFVHLVDWSYAACYHAARFEKDSRYYVIRLSKDLLDDWVITLTNGRIKSKLGQSRTLAFTDFNEGWEHFCALAKVRHQRGYVLKNLSCDNYLILHLLPYFIADLEKRPLPERKTFKNTKQRKKGETAPALINSLAHTSSRQLGFLF